MTCANEFGLFPSVLAMAHSLLLIAVLMATCQWRSFRAAWRQWPSCIDLRAVFIPVPFRRIQRLFRLEEARCGAAAATG